MLKTNFTRDFYDAQTDSYKVMDIDACGSGQYIVTVPNTSDQYTLIAYNSIFISHTEKKIEVASTFTHLECYILVVGILP